MQRKSAVAVCLLAAAILLACSRNAAPNSLFENAGYHVRDGKVYYLNAFPGKAFEISTADAGTFSAFDSTYGRDKSHVYLDGAQLPNADPSSFELLARPGFAKDRHHVYQRDRAISDDPDNFELLDGNLAKDGHAVYWLDGSVLSTDPGHFTVISTVDNYIFTKDSHSVHVNGNPIADANPAAFQILRGAYARDDQRVFYFDRHVAEADSSSFRTLEGPYASDSNHAYWMGEAIEEADPNTFRVLNADFECSADDARAYYRQTVIAGADPRTFPPSRAVTNCSETSVSFAD